MIVPRTFGAYVQSKKTSDGFQRMKRRGMPLPPFQVEQAMSKIVKIEYDEMLAEIEKMALVASAQHGVGVQDALPLTEILIKNLKAQIKELEGSDYENADKLRNKFSRQLATAQKSFFEDFFEDAGQKMQTRIAYALEKDRVFEGRLDGIRAGYLDSAMLRVSEGKSDLRKKFVKILGEWMEGKRKDLNGLDDVMDKIRKESDNFSKFFARDQLSRMNRALAITSYDEADAKWVKMVTVGDQRVRKSHRALNGKIFKINDLPKEYLDYNCRCGWLPVFELTPNMKVTKGDGIDFIGMAA